MNWSVFEYETSRGDRPVTLFIRSIRIKTVAKISRLIDLLSEYGPNLPMPYSRRLDTDLYELRTRDKEQARIIYAFHNRKIYLLHGFIKKTNKTPPREIKLAQQRLKYLTSI